MKSSRWLRLLRACVGSNLVERRSKLTTYTAHSNAHEEDWRDVGCSWTSSKFFAQLERLTDGVSGPVSDYNNCTKNISYRRLYQFTTSKMGRTSSDMRKSLKDRWWVTEEEEVRRPVGGITYSGTLQIFWKWEIGKRLQEVGIVAGRVRRSSLNSGCSATEKEGMKTPGKTKHLNNTVIDEHDPNEQV